MSIELGFDKSFAHEEYDGQGEHIQLSDEVVAQLMARDNAIRYASVSSVSLASFVRGVRQI